MARRCIGGDSLGKKNRYDYACKCYKDCVVLLLNKNKLYTYKDNKLCDFKKINKLKKLHIYYVILDNLDVIEQEYVDNRYQEYYLKSSLNDILDIILNNIRKGMG